ncbi:MULTISPECIES: ATPase F0F1 [unclassified Paenibacillus]|nr:MULTISPECIES: ATPase F0F1 [unclassified Paenibacillus]SDW84886.1 hypothetical protein SAMN05518848_103119 [Paenibacillus sp. PDC88]
MKNEILTHFPYTALSKGWVVSTMNQDKPWLIALAIGGSGILLATYITIGFFAGRWLMNLIDGEAYIIAIGCMAGLVLGVLNIAMFIKKFLGAQND